MPSYLVKLAIGPLLPQLGRRSIAVAKQLSFAIGMQLAVVAFVRLHRKYSFASVA